MQGCPESGRNPCACGSQFAGWSAERIQHLMDVLKGLLEEKRDHPVSHHGYRYGLQSAERSDARWHVLTWLEGDFAGRSCAAWVTDQGVFVHGIAAGLDWKRDEVDSCPNMRLPWHEVTLGVPAMKKLTPEDPLTIVA